MKRAFEGAVSALCYSFIRAHFGARAGEPGPAWNRTVGFVLAQHARMPDYLRLPFKLLTLVFVAWSNFPRLAGYRNLTPDGRWTRIERMRRSPLGPFRDLVRFYEGLSIFGFHDELARTAASPALSAPTNAQAAARTSPALGALAPVEDSEIVVIGSGPGGAITACLLAEAGHEVTLVDSGPFLTLEECQPFTREEMERKYRNGGMTAALGGTKVAYVEANCVGGGSEINAGLYHRTPENILDAWRREFQLEHADLSDMVLHFEACERDVSISHLPGTVPAASLKLHQGAQIKGWTSLEVPRWFKYSSGGAGEKQSMSRTFIPRALKAGCKLVPGVRARRLTRSRGRWVVDAERTLPDGLRSRHRLGCKTLFVCCGAIQTPALLQASGIAPFAGRTLRMHPTVKVVARFGDAINSRDMGVPVHQVKEFAPRLSFGCSISGEPHLALAMLDHPAHAHEVGEGWPHMAIYYAMITGGSGSVARLPGCRDPLVRFTLAGADMRDLAEGTRKLCELLFAAGAEALYPTVDAAAPLYHIDDLVKVDDPLPHRRTSLMTIHLFSSCPMGEDKRRCVTDSFGRVHGHDGLYIADASLLCTAPGVNPQGSIMAFARRNALHFLDRQ
ncbi:MAG: GMC family oxidoreductase N-terminal domain-containing protein [Hyphomicrobiaceae bacterium]|nr:GMC family oxidoreductase N-terminal domain-containing protein [Hyphomicrobiaceae bacterium]